MSALHVCACCGETAGIPSQTPQGEWICLGCLTEIATSPDTRDAVLDEIESIYGGDARRAAEEVAS